MHDPEYDIHPLDRDYSEPSTVSRRRERSPQENFRRWGIIVFATGLAIVLVSAILLGVFRDIRWLEGFGSAMHRFGMLAILGGGIGIIVSYRFPMTHGKGKQKRDPRRRSFMKTFAMLLMASVLLIVVLSLISYWPVITRSRNFSVLVNHWFQVLYCGILVTLSFWHRWMVKAYAIGSLAALLFNQLTFFQMLNYGLGSGSLSFGYVISNAIVPITGLVCALYVGLFVPEASSDRLNR